MIGSRLACCLALIILSLSFAGTVFAHESRPAYLGLTQSDADRFEVLWKVPAKGPQQRLSLNALFSGGATVIPGTRTSRYVAGAVIERFALRDSGELAGTTIFIEGLSPTLTDVLVRIERLDGSTLLRRISPDEPRFEIQGATASNQVARTYTTLGILHIWEGTDHLLFVVCLILITGVGRRLLATISGFTIAHSLTLALSTLGVVRLPTPPIEAAVALSIVFLAAEIARANEQTLSYRYPISVSSCFGLVHGFGFASVLSEIGLPPLDVPAALLFFNIGVEIGQIIFVVALIGAHAVIATLVPKIHGGRGKEIANRTSAYAIGTIASFWLLQRLSVF